MAKEMTFRIEDDAVALRIRDKVDANQGYEKNRFQDPNPAFNSEVPEDPDTNPRYINIESKGDFFRRVTINWWAGQVSARENREDHDAKQAEILAFTITSSEI